jgi:hypothetical protein
MTTTEEKARARSRAYYAANKEKILARRKAKTTAPEPEPAATKLPLHPRGRGCSPFPFQQLPDELQRHVCSFLSGTPQFASVFTVHPPPLVVRAHHDEQAAKRLRQCIEERKVTMTFVLDLADGYKTKHILEAEMQVVKDLGEEGLDRAYRTLCHVLNVKMRRKMNETLSDLVLKAKTRFRWEAPR